MSKTVLYSVVFVSRQAANNVHLLFYYFNTVPESGALGHDTLGLICMVHHLHSLLGKELYSNSVLTNLCCVHAYKYRMYFY